MQDAIIPSHIQNIIQENQLLVNAVKTQISRQIVGQDRLVDALLTGLFTGGHILIEGVPGLAKTSAVKALAGAVQADFKLFNHVILADEINRAPSKVQSALLEAMEEKQVTIGDKTYPLPSPFLVLATQNPIEQEGTYPLPEAQMDRFMLKVLIDYPDKHQELEILKKISFAAPEPVEPVITCEQLGDMARLINQIYVDEKLKGYMVDLICATRNPEDYGMDIAPYIEFGASPRATIFLARAARVTAFLAGRAYVTPQDIKTVGPDVLRHRILLSFEAQAEDMNTDHIITQLFDSVPVP